MDIFYHAINFVHLAEKNYNADVDIGICTECDIGFYWEMEIYKGKSNKENNKYNYFKNR